MTALTANASIIYAALLSHAEGCSETDAEGFTWRQIYLDNAKPSYLTGREFAGYLSSLKRAGLYRTQGDDCFGLVRLPAEPAPTDQADQAIAAIEAGLAEAGVNAAPISTAWDPDNKTARYVPARCSARNWGAYDQQIGDFHRNGSGRTVAFALGVEAQAMCDALNGKARGMRPQQQQQQQAKASSRTLFIAIMRAGDLTFTLRVEAADYDAAVALISKAEPRAEIVRLTSCGDQDHRLSRTVGAAITR